MNNAIISNIKKKDTLRRKLRKSPTSINLREKESPWRKCYVKVGQITFTLFVVIMEITQSVSDCR